MSRSAISGGDISGDGIEPRRSRSGVLIRTLADMALVGMSRVIVAAVDNIEHGIDIGTSETIGRCRCHHWCQHDSAFEGGKHDLVGALTTVIPATCNLHCHLASPQMAMALP